ncbi:hypothetical protein EIP91_001457 [Steccherinum ochraceum]|uniref:BTB domain-containing protein n=1 Tax=Steccherinum ochraceum TaxID=92696 RepID=A0A4R0RHT2_9APHY|nr:hypothetical protein EIP91_001457 [Steccherinum ochraceum]
MHAHVSTRAAAPFDGDPSQPQADVVLRTADNVDFYLHMVLLSLGSPFFRDLFSLSQPTTSASNSGSESIQLRNGTTVPVIPISEDGDALDCVLRFLYPLAEVTLPADLYLLSKALEASMKYDLEKSSSLLKEHLSSFSGEDSLEVYSIACRLNLEAHAAHAASDIKTQFSSTTYGTCTWNQAHLEDEDVGGPAPCADGNCRHQTFIFTRYNLDSDVLMEKITASCYHRLLRYVFSGEDTTFCYSLSSNTSVVNDHDDTSGSGSAVSISSFESFPVTQDLRHYPTDLLLRSVDGRKIPTYQLLLAFASATSILAKARDPACPSEDGLPAVDMDEDQTTLLGLLHLCQPMRAVAGPPPSLLQCRAVWTAAEKYGMTTVANRAKELCLDHLGNAPLSVYLVASSCGWQEEARAAALRCAQISLLDSGIPYVAEMESSSALALNRLYKYLHDYRMTAADIAWRYQHSLPQEEQLDPPERVTLAHWSAIPPGIPLIAAAVQMRHKSKHDTVSPGRDDSTLSAWRSVQLFREVECALRLVQLKTDVPRRKWTVV